MKKIIVIGLFLLLALTFIFACAKTETTSSSVAPAPNRYLQSFSGQNIIDWDYHIYLSNRPVVPSPEACVLRLNGRVLSPEVDYVFPSRVYIPILGQYMTFPTATLAYLNDNNDPSDGYATGTILITNQALISPESDLSVVYESLPSYRV
ncbi:MAG: hypothetical protein ABIH69_03125, partial [bacterium]